MATGGRYWSFRPVSIGTLVALSATKIPSSPAPAGTVKTACASFVVCGIIRRPSYPRAMKPRCNSSRWKFLPINVTLVPPSSDARGDRIPLTMNPSSTVMVNTSSTLSIPLSDMVTGKTPGIALPEATSSGRSHRIFVVDWTTAWVSASPTRQWTSSNAMK